MKYDITEELEKIKQELKAIKGNEQSNNYNKNELNMEQIISLIIEERERTNKMLEEITNKVRKLEELIETSDESDEIVVGNYNEEKKEILLSEVDTKIVEFVQNKGMVTADELKIYMNYKGKNAASARLNKLYKMGLLTKYQLGHKVYYKFDAGKATYSVIITPPQ